jgi:hypothetical protein
MVTACSSNEQATTTPGATTSSGDTSPGTTPGSTADPSIRDADLRGMPVPAAWCDGLTGVVDGTAGAANPGEGKAASSPAFKLEDDVVYGDVDGDGVEDAVALLSCFWWNSDAAETHVAIFSIREGRPTVVGTIDDAGVQHATIDGLGSVTYPKASNVRLEGDHVVVDWANEELPATTTTVRYLVMNGTPTVANDTGPTFPTP